MTQFVEFTDIVSEDVMIYINIEKKVAITRLLLSLPVWSIRIIFSFYLSLYIWQYIMHNVQDYNTLYNKAFLPAIWHFTRMWKTLAWPRSSQTDEVGSIKLV